MRRTSSHGHLFNWRHCPPDIVGLNYYLTSDRHLDTDIGRYPPHRVGGNSLLPYADIEAVRGRPQGIVGHEQHLLEAWRRYGIPVAITETHLGCTREEQMRWMAEAWHGAQAARQHGAAVRAVTVWALLGSFDWSSLVTAERGHYEPGAFDVRSAPPRPTALAHLAAELIDGRQLRRPVLEGMPWWRNGHPPGAVANAHHGPSVPPPILIVGATGTLGAAFSRISMRRGLACRAVGREEVDITSSASVEALIDRYRPWAVVNDAGFVRVDAAELEADECYACNVQGAVRLAEACAARRLPFVTFSSDLVFDGSRDTPYVESDPPGALGVYGATKAEAEGAVLRVLPDALVIRTSAFFGPWDRSNFLVQLFESLDRRALFHAACDQVVSPTYVPELVDAALDLLIDGEGGGWHLANQGATTWYEFGRLAAERSGRDVGLIVPVTGTTAGRGAARRPAYSALGSERGVLLRPLHAALDDFLNEIPDTRLCASA